MTDKHQCSMCNDTGWVPVKARDGGSVPCVTCEEGLKNQRGLMEALRDLRALRDWSRSIGREDKLKGSPDE